MGAVSIFMGHEYQGAKSAKLHEKKSDLAAAMGNCSHSFTESSWEGSLLGGYGGQPPWWLNAALDILAKWEFPSAIGVLK